MANPAEKPKALPKREVLDPAIKKYVRERFREIEKGLPFTKDFEKNKLLAWLEEQGIDDPKKRERIAEAGLRDLKERLIAESPERKEVAKKTYENLDKAMNEIYSKSKTGIAFVDKMIDNISRKGVMKITGIVALLSLATEFLDKQTDANGKKKHPFIIDQLKKIIAKLDPTKEVKDKEGKTKKQKKTPEELVKDGFDAVTAFLKIPREGIEFEEPKAKDYEPFLKGGAGKLITRISEAVQDNGAIGIVQKGIKKNNNLDNFKYQLSDINLNEPRASYIAAILLSKEVKKRPEDNKRKPVAQWNAEDCREFIEDVKKESSFTFEHVSI